MDKEELKTILDSHAARLSGNGADLRGADLRGADLRGADLYCANLRGADLYCADLYCANLRGANLRGANLYCANLYCADLYGADLRGAKAIPAYIAASLTACPEEGAVIGWKKGSNQTLVKLSIPAEARRSSATTRQCRAEYADVVAIYDAYGRPICEAYSDRGGHYVVGERVFPDSWDENRWNECSHGIHFFITRKEAEDY